MLVESQKLEGPGEIRRQRGQQLHGVILGPRSWQVEAVEVEVQGHPGSLCRSQVEAIQEGLVQDLGCEMQVRFQHCPLEERSDSIGLAQMVTGQ